MKRLAVALLLFVSPARAQTVGATLLAAGSPRFPATEALRMFRGVKHAHAAILWDTFGRNKTFLRRFVKLRAEKITIEIHPTCGPCRRNAGYGPQSVPGERGLIRSIANFALSHETPNVRFLLSLELEDQFRAEEAKDVYLRIRALWPLGIVRNAIPAFVSAGPWDFTELHSDSAECPAAGERYIADLDGDDLGFGSKLGAWLRRNKHCGFVRVWRAAWQGIGTPEFVPVDRRRPAISRGDVVQMNGLMRVFNGEIHTR